jgi:hypothetical protein
LAFGHFNKFCVIFFVFFYKKKKKKKKKKKGFSTLLNEF